MMAEIDGLVLLRDLLLSCKAIKDEDRSIVSNLCETLRIDQDYGFLNDYFRMQVQIEATQIYLLGKYNLLLDRWESLIDKHKAEKAFELGDRNQEGYKWTKESKEQWLLNSDARYILLREQAQEVKRFLGILKDLYTIVFTRANKLEQLSINYRREMRADTDRG